MTDRNGQKAAKEQCRAAAPPGQSAGRPRRRSVPLLGRCERPGPSLLPGQISGVLLGTAERGESESAQPRGELVDDGRSGCLAIAMATRVSECGSG